MKRSVEAYTTLYIALWKIYLEKFLENNPEIERDVRRANANIIDDLIDDCLKGDNDGMVHNVSSMTEILKSISFPQMQENFDLQLKHQAKFLRNFMTMFEKLLLFIRATRRGLWHLHL